MDNDWIYLYFICTLSTLYPLKIHPLSGPTYLRSTADNKPYLQIGADWQTCRYGEIIADQIGSDNRHVYRHILSADSTISRTLSDGQIFPI